MSGNTGLPNFRGLGYHVWQFECVPRRHVFKACIAAVSRGRDIRSERSEVRSFFLMYSYMPNIIRYEDFLYEVVYTYTVYRIHTYMLSLAGASDGLIV